MTFFSDYYCTVGSYVSSSNLTAFQYHGASDNVYLVISIFRFILGFGAGGIYPLSASAAAEGATDVVSSMNTVAWVHKPSIPPPPPLNSEIAYLSSFALIFIFPTDCLIVVIYQALGRWLFHSCVALTTWFTTRRSSGRHREPWRRMSWYSTTSISPHVLVLNHLYIASCLGTQPPRLS